MNDRRHAALAGDPAGREQVHVGAGELDVSDDRDAIVHQLNARLFERISQLQRRRALLQFPALSTKWKISQGPGNGSTLLLVVSCTICAD